MKYLIAVASLLPLTVPALSQSVVVNSYDARGRLTKTEDGVGRKTNYEFDAADNRKNLIAVSQFSTSYSALNLHHNTGFADNGGWAATVNSPYGALVYGPYASDTPVGSRVATYRAMIDVVDAADGPVLYIDVYDATAGEVLATRHLNRSDWRAPFSYQLFELPFEWSSARAGHQIEIRVWYNRIAYARVEKVGYY